MNGNALNQNAGAILQSLLEAKLEENERFAESLAYVNQLNPNPFLTENQLRISLENRELELNNGYVENFEKINGEIQKFVEKISQMSAICDELTRRIQSNKERTRDLLGKTSILQNEKKAAIAKHDQLEAFFSRFCLTDEEERTLAQSAGFLTEAFFATLKRLVAIREEVNAQLHVKGDNSDALQKIASQLEEKLDSAFDVLSQSVIRECRLLNVDFADVKLTLVRSMELLRVARPEFFERALKEYAMARKGNIVRVYIDALTKGAKSGAQKPIEALSNEPLSYASEMLAWIEFCVKGERELCAALLRDCAADARLASAQPLLANISDALCQPLRIRVEQVVAKENEPVTLLKLSSIFLYYKNVLQVELGENATLVKTLMDLRELTSSMFFSAISSIVQKIIANMSVPDYNLQPMNAVHRALALLREILDSQGENQNYYSIMDKKETFTKIFLHILDPLHQSIQLVCSNLHNPLDVAVYMLNCLHAIRSVLILYQYTESKLEMIKAQIEANEDVLVSEQASQILTNSDLMEIYVKAMAHRPNQGPLSKIAGMEPARVGAALDAFRAFVERQPREYECHQAERIASARIRESVERRTLENVVVAYAAIRDKLIEPTNEYPTFENLYSGEELERLFFKAR